MPTRESGLVRAIVRAVAGTYPEAWVVKIHGDPYQVIGIPDLLACANGRMVGMEVKHPRPGESLTHARDRATYPQLAMLAGIRTAGGLAAVVTSVAEALELVGQAYREDG